MKRFWLAMAVAGALVPYGVFFWQLSARGWDFGAWLGVMTIAPTSWFWIADLVMATLVLLAVCTHDLMGGDGRMVWTILGTLLGVSVGLPLYFYFAEDRPQRRAAAMRAATRGIGRR